MWGFGGNDDKGARRPTPGRQELPWVQLFRFVAWRTIYTPDEGHAADADRPSSDAYISVSTRHHFRTENGVQSPNCHANFIHPYYLLRLRAFLMFPQMVANLPLGSTAVTVSPSE